MNFRAAYQEHQHQTRLLLMRSRGQGRVRLAHRTVNADHLTPRQIDDLALRDAEHVVNIAIHQHREEMARKARRGVAADA